MVEPAQVALSLALGCAMVVLAGFSRLKNWLVPVSFILCVNYGVWRAGTLHTESWAGFAIVWTLYLAELYGIVLYLLFHYQAGRTAGWSSPAPEDRELPPVDILIPIYNEPKEILYRTVVGCRALDYPKGKLKTYVLDDGARPEIKELTRRLGCQYLARPGREHAKAGNLNYGLSHSSGEVVAVFDCDHVPVKSFLKETVGFFRDPEVAFVQTPHTFYNQDPFQKNLRLEGEIVNEQALFFYVIQPAKDFYNSAFFAGSGGLLRRSSLEGIGGFKAETVTEDIHTSMELHARGFRSVFVNKRLSAGLAPESFAGYLKQRKRWAIGAVQLFLLDNPCFKKGLSLHQRLNYLASIFYFFHGLPRIVYLSTPLAPLILGIPPFTAGVLNLLAIYLPYAVASWVAFHWVSGRHRNPFWSDVYETAMCFGVAQAAFSTLLKPRGYSFAVTPKWERFDKWTVDPFLILPHGILLALLLAGLGSGCYRIFLGLGNYGAISISLVWAVYNIVVLGAALSAALEKPQRRSFIRLKRAIPCKLKVGNEAIPCVTRDISEGGLSLKLARPVEVPLPTVSLSLPGSRKPTGLKGRVVRYDEEDNGEMVLAVQFVGMKDKDCRTMLRQVFCPEDAWHSVPQPSVAAWRSLGLLLSSVSRVWVRDRIRKRVSPRVAVHLPCEVELPDGVARGTTVNASLSGLCVKLDGSGPLPNRVSLSLVSELEKPIGMEGHVVWQKGENGALLAGIELLKSDAKGALLRILRNGYEDLGRNGDGKFKEQTERSTEVSPCRFSLHLFRIFLRTAFPGL